MRMSALQEWAEIDGEVDWNVALVEFPAAPGMMTPGELARLLNDVEALHDAVAALLGAEVVRGESFAATPRWRPRLAEGNVYVEAMGYGSPAWVKVVATRAALVGMAVVLHQTPGFSLDSATTKEIVDFLAEAIASAAVTPPVPSRQRNAPARDAKGRPPNSGSAVGTGGMGVRGDDAAANKIKKLVVRLRGLGIAIDVEYSARPSGTAASDDDD